MIAAQMGFVYASWAVVIAAIGGYAWSVTQRGRRLSKQVPPEKRRWL